MLMTSSSSNRQKAAGAIWLPLLLILIIVSGTQSESDDENLTYDNPKPKLPIFAENYYTKGILSLPYAELSEPFEAWFDKESGKSRNDFYGDLYKIYQFAPTNKQRGEDENYGVMYKLAYVPASFKPSESFAEKIVDSISKEAEKLIEKSLFKKKSPITTTQTRRACFKVSGGVGFTISPQTVLPDMSDFTYQGSGRCPHFNSNYGQETNHSNKRCECWKKVTSMGDKINTYKMWILRDRNLTQDVKPVFYSMTGYNNVFGSHFDRYDISYFRFEANGADEKDFHLDEGENLCEPMPGPGFDNNIDHEMSISEKRFHFVAANPFHEYVEEPHRYDHVDHKFDEFAKEHSKEYQSDKHLHEGWLNFLHNLRYIHSKNRELKSYKLAINKFADNNPRDLAYLRGRRSTARLGNLEGGLDYNHHHKHLRLANGQFKEKLPESWDWSIRGAVTPVKDQAVCGSCWSFGTSGTVEGANFAKTGKLLRLSQQQMVDCSWEYKNNGCDGGEDFRAYQYIMKAGGLATEQDYGHYLGVDGKCHDNDVKKAVQISGWYNVTANDREALKHAIVTYGPTSVSIDASPPTFTFYSHGVYYDEKCHNNPDQLDHAVLAVGYTEMDGKFVWQVKNSWSTNWGNNGYIMMSAENNNCGVMDAPTVPIIKT